ncbi:MAG: hypothetical protein ACTMIK_07155 [Galactobacter sp.]
MTTLQQIIYTEHPARWHALAAALGFRPTTPLTQAWTEFDADGVLAVHRAYASRPAGTADLTVLVTDLDDARRRLAHFTVEEGTMPDVGAILSFTSSEGVVVTIAEAAKRPSLRGLTVEPIWFQHDLTQPRAFLEALGFRARIVGQDGGWAQLQAPDGGRVGLHSGDTRVEASFREDTDLDALAERVRDAGFEAAIIDESYARTLRVQNPDGGDELWINGRQDDLYGYRDESDAATSFR